MLDIDWLMNKVQVSLNDQKQAAGRIVLVCNVMNTYSEFLFKRQIKHSRSDR